MAKSIKKISLVLLSFLMVLCLGFAFARINTASAASENASATDLGSVTVAERTVRMEMVDGAYIRSEDPTGIRFITYVAIEDYNAIVAEFGKDGVEFGTELTANGVTNSIVAQKVTKVGDDIMRYATVIAEIPADMYGTDITAKSYVKIGEDIQYTSNSVTRSIEDVAATALSVPTSLDNATRTLFEGFAGVTDKTEQAQIVVDASLTNTVAEQIAQSLNSTVNYVFDATATDASSSVAITNEFAKNNAGEKTYTVYTADGIVKVKALVATDIFYSKEDILAFAPIYKDNKAGQYYMLGANIDLQGTNITTYSGSTWTTAYSWDAIFDGQGYAISNASCTHGFFASVTAKGVIKNMSLINISKAANGGGLFSNGLTGKVENVFLHGTITTGTVTSQGGIGATVQPTTVANNVIGLIEYTAAGLNGGFANLSSGAGSTMSNVAIVSTKATVLNSAPSVNVTNSALYSKISDLATNFDTTSFGAGWELIGGVPVLTKSIPALNAYFNSVSINGSDEIKTGSVITASSIYATLSIKEDIDVTIGANGVVTIGAGVADGSTFTVVANLFGKTVERTFTAKTIVDKTNVKYFIEKANTANAIDLTALGITGADIKSMTTTTGEALAFEGTGSTITVNGSSANVNVNALVDIATISGETYRVSATIVTDVLYNKEDVLAFAVNYKNNTASDYYMLGANIDMGGTNLTTYTGSTWALANEWKATFDGQGYALSNIAYTHGLFATMTSTTSVVKNLTIINAQKASNGGALIANTCNGLIENVFLHGTITSGTPTAQAGIVANAYNSTVRNAVILLDWTGNGSNTVFSANNSGKASATNVIGISAKSIGACAVGTATNVQNFASIDAFYASNFDTSAFTGVWELYNGLPIHTNAKSALLAYFATTSLTINGSDVVASGDAITTNSAYASLSIKDNANISINAKGVITFGAGVVDGSTFTVVANAFGKIVEKTFTAKVIVDKTVYSFNVLKSQDINVFDLATLSTSITNAESQVASIKTTTDIVVDYATDGSLISIDGTTTNLVKGTEYVLDIALTSGEVYRIKAYVADQFINSEAEFKTFYAARNLGYVATTGKVVALNVDIDFNGFDLSTLENDPANNKRGQAWTEIFDGRGHVLSNATVYRSLFGYINIGGRVRNLGVVNFVDTYNPTSGEPTGFIAWRVLNSNAVVENCYVYATNVGKLQSGIVGFNGGSATSGHTTQVNNCVAIIENAEGTTGEGIVYSVPGQALASCGSSTNIFGVSTTRTKVAQLDYGAHINNAVYTSVAALNAAGVAATALNGVGPWSVVNGSLYFGNTEVGAMPTSVANNLVENGKSNYSIVVPDNATKLENLAATEIQKYLKLSTGANLNIVTESYIGNNNYISVGNTKISKQYLAVSTTNAFSIRTDTNGNYYLTGADEYGTVFSVYEFLERFIGFDAISADEIIYNKTATLNNINLTINETPSFESRIVANKQGYLVGSEDSNDAYLFRYIHGHGEVNDPVINELGNSSSSMYYHTVFRYLDPEYFNNQAEHPDKYNPGWFSKANVQDITELQLCYTAHGDATNYSIMQRKVLEVLWANVQANTKEVMNYSFSQYDNTYWCECSACTAEYKKYGTHSAAMMKFVNDLKRGLDAKMLEAGDNREVTLWVYSYLKTEIAPATSTSNGLVPLDDSVKAVDGVGVVYAMGYGDYTVDITNSNFNQTSPVTGSKTNYYENLKRWAVITDDLYVWMYGTSFSRYFAPYLTFDSTQKTLQELAKYGVDKIFFEGQHFDTTPVATGFTYFKDYLEGKLMWNVNEDVNALTDKFFTNYFGPASTEMRAYYDSLNAYWNDNNKHYHAFTSLDSAWNKTAVAKWIKNIENAKSALSTALSNGTITQDRYNVLLNRVEIENVAVMYMNIVSGGNTTTNYKKQFKALVEGFGYTEYGQGYSISTLWKNWGIA